MSSLPEIELDVVTTPEDVLYEAQRIERLDGKHAQAHKGPDGLGMNSCETCRRLRLILRSTVEGKLVFTSTGIEIEKVARIMCKQNAGIKWSATGAISFESYWDLVLTYGTRNEYRRKAEEIVYAVHGNELG